MLTKRIAVGLLIVVVAGFFSLSLPTSTVSGEEQAAGATTIQLGDFWFGAAANQVPVGKPEANIATINGAASGEIVLVFQNAGKLEHEVVIPGLFATTTEVKVKSFDANGKEISMVETVGALREIELQPGTKTEVTLALDEPIIRAFEDNPDLALQFEIGCHVGHGTAADHYKAGMRGFITLKK